MLSKLLTRKEQLVLLALAGGLLVGSVTLYAFRGTARPDVAQALTFAPAPRTAIAAPQPPELEPVVKPDAVPASNATPATAEQHAVTVSVRGAVALPGVYEFSPGARVQEAVDRAGGPIETADLSDVNLAARLMDGSTLTVPEGPRSDSRFAARAGGTLPANPAAYTISGWQPTSEAPEPAPALGATAGGGSASGLLDLNAASEMELQSLPGIGPKLAAQIVQYRADTRFTRVEDLEEVSGIGPKKLESIRPFVTVR